MLAAYEANYLLNGFLLCCHGGTVLQRSVYDLTNGVPHYSSGDSLGTSRISSCRIHNKSEIVLINVSVSWMKSMSLRVDSDSSTVDVFHELNITKVFQKREALPSETLSSL